MAMADDSRADKEGAGRPRVPLGRAVRWSEEELERWLSGEGLERLAEEAAADWRENAPPRYKELLDADGEAGPAGG